MILKKQKPCPYCERRVPFLDNDGVEMRLVYGNQLYASVQHSKMAFVTINYCPMCGRKLGDAE